MGNAKDTVLGILSSLAANMAAAPLATILAAQIIGKPVSPMDAAQCAGYGALLLGSTYWQVCRGQKSNHIEAERIARVEALLLKLSVQEDTARQELADLILEQRWVREALEQPEGVARFNAAWRHEVSEGLTTLGLNLVEVESTLSQLATLELDTNSRLVVVQKSTKRTEAKVDEVLSEVQQMAAAIRQLSETLVAMQGLRAENESLKSQIAAVTERYLEAERARGRSWRDVIKELRHDPKKLGAFLDSETQTDELELIQKHRERAAIWYLTGDFEKSMVSWNKILALVPNDPWALNGLGNIEVLRSNLPEAERLFRIVIDRAVEDESTAGSLGNLALIQIVRCDFVAAEATVRASLAICEKLGLIGTMGNQFSNLGVIEMERGNLAVAESHHKRALEIFQAVGSDIGIANQYGSMGIIEKERGRLDRAEKLIRMSLEINERLGRLSVIANDFGNLGNIEALRENWNPAEVWFKKALDIHEKLGQREKAARQYRNLGSVEFYRGNKSEARRLWERSRDLFRAVGVGSMERLVQGQLDRLL